MFPRRWAPGARRRWAPAAGRAYPSPVMSRRRRLALLLVPIGVFLVLANTGSVLAPSWAHHHPALLLSFDSRNRHLLLTVGGGLAPPAFFSIGFCRRLFTDP